MVHDGETRSEESIPPTTTRWSDSRERPASDDYDDLTPPFVPGRGQPPEDETSAEAAHAPEPSGGADPAAPEVEGPAEGEPMIGQSAAVEEAAREPAGQAEADTASEEADRESDTPEWDAGESPWETGVEEPSEFVTPYAPEPEQEPDPQAEKAVFQEEPVAFEEEELELEEPAAFEEEEGAFQEPAAFEEETAAFEQDIAAYEADEPEDEYDDFPVDSFDLEGEGEAEAEATPSTPEATDPDAGWSPADLYGDDLDDFDDTGAGAPTGSEEEGAPQAGPDPWDQPDEMLSDEGGEAWDEPDATETPIEELELAPGDADIDGVAALLERLARLVREEGPEALRSEMDSADRFTAALAGLLAGYLAR